MIRLGRGAWKGRVLRPPCMMRPTSGLVRGAAMDIAGPGWIEGRTVWDLCCGSGAFGLECLSAGASCCLFVDEDPACTSFVASALSDLGAPDRGRVLLCDVRRLDRAVLPPPDMVFVDPPYDDARIYSWVHSLDWAGTVSPGGILVVESRARSAVPEGFLTRRYGDTMLSWRWFR